LSNVATTQIRADAFMSVSIPMPAPPVVPAHLLD
jgi:hypothetical protein